jgi:hypothetical protein
MREKSTALLRDSTECSAQRKHVERAMTGTRWLAGLLQVSGVSTTIESSVFVPHRLPGSDNFGSLY